MKNNQLAKLILPKKKDAFIEFKHFKNTFSCPFVIYADFESILNPTKGDDKITHKETSYRSKERQKGIIIKT